MKFSNIILQINIFLRKTVALKLGTSKFQMTLKLLRSMLLSFQKKMKYYGGGAIFW